MGTSVTFDEFHLIVLALSDLEDAACEAIQGVLESQRFRSALRQILRQYPDLAAIRVRLSV